VTRHDAAYLIPQVNGGVATMHPLDRTRLKCVRGLRASGSLLTAERFP
jgi:hypothetical protein